MSLNALRVALQGAGFALSPIQLAIQGLLEEIEEQKKEELGKGGATRQPRERKRKARKRVAPELPAPRPIRTEDLTWPEVHRPRERPELFDEERISAQNHAILATIMAAVTSGALDG